MATDWAEAEAIGVALMAGDLNARTAGGRDWPEGEPGWEPRRSMDVGQPNGHGMQLLEFCQCSSARVCNGRVAGSSSGAATSYGVSGQGQAVVDYFVGSAGLLPLLQQLEVLPDHAAAELADHAVLRLIVAATAQQQTGTPPPPPWPNDTDRQQRPTQRQFRCDPERLADAVAALGELSGQLAAIADAAEAASTQKDVDGVAAWFTEVVCNALEDAHMREMVWGGSRQPKQQTRRRLLNLQF